MPTANSFLLGIILVIISAICGTFGSILVKNNWGFWNKKQQPIIDEKHIKNDSKVHSLDQISIDKIAKATAEATISVIEKQQKADLDIRYNSYEVFGISKDGIFVKLDEPPKEFIVNWEQMRVISQDDSSVTIRLPDMNLRSNRFTNPMTTISKKVGYKNTLISIGEYGVKIEVLDIKNDMLIVALGFNVNK